MNRLEFNACDYPTIGVEIELALVDNQTMALSNKNAQILNRIPTEFANQPMPTCGPRFIHYMMLPVPKTYSSTGRAHTLSLSGQTKKSHPMTATWVLSTFSKTPRAGWSPLVCMCM